MGKIEVFECEPNFVIPPGETLLETIEEKGIKQSELAKRTGRPLKTINEIIKGKSSITYETALQFEKVLGIPASFWMNLENNYKQALALENEKEELSKHVDWLEQFPVKQMITEGWLDKKDDEVEQLDTLLKYFEVASPESFDQVWEPCVQYRKSQKLKSEPGSLAAWVRKGEIEAEALETSPYNRAKFKQSLQQIRELTNISDPQEFFPKLQQLCADSGVALIFVPELKGCRASGVTKWLYSDKAMIILSARHKTSDHLWFTFFHEAAHILLHGKRQLFIEGEKSDNQAEENEANEYAAEILIPSKKYQKLISFGKPSKREVINFAKEIGISPCIVVGRLQRDKIIPYSYYNDLKTRYIVD